MCSKDTMEVKELQDNYVVCSDCGCYISQEDETTVVDGTTICNECMLQYEKCEDCGEYHRRNDMRELHDGGYICENCYDYKDYGTCENCGRAVHLDDVIPVRYRDCPDEWEYYCPECIESMCRNNEITVCDDCGQYVYRDWTYEDDDQTICNHCYISNNYCTCNECGAIIAENNAYWDTYTEAYYCEACYDELENNKYIKQYHNGASCGLKFYETTAEPTYNNGHIRYFGIELEVDDGDRDAAVENVFYVLNGSYDQDADRYAHFEDDGSLGNEGFEIITQPMTRAYLETFRPRIEEATKILSRAGFRSHDARMCGLHIHVSRDTLTTQTINNMIYAISLFWHTCVRISRRTSNQLAHYACSYAHKCGADDTPDKIIERTKDAMLKRNRYYALNTTNKETIELRICRGTLNVNTIYASLDFFAALIKFAETYSENDMMEMSVDDFNNYLRNFSSRLATYIEECGL